MFLRSLHFSTVNPHFFCFVRHASPGKVECISIVVNKISLCHCVWTLEQFFKTRRISASSRNIVVLWTSFTRWEEMCMMFTINGLVHAALLNWELVGETRNRQQVFVYANDLWKMLVHLIGAIICAFRDRHLQVMKWLLRLWTLDSSSKYFKNNAYIVRKRNIIIFRPIICNSL